MGFKDFEVEFYALGQLFREVGQAAQCLFEVVTLNYRFNYITKSHTGVEGLAMSLETSQHLGNFIIGFDNTVIVMRQLFL